MKNFFRSIHLYLSLAAGIVIAIVCFTGAVLVFEKELQEAFNKERYYVAPTGTRLPLDALVQRVKKEVPKGKVGAIKVYPDAARTVEVSLFMPEKEGEGKRAGEHKEGRPAEGMRAAGGKANASTGGPGGVGGPGRTGGPGGHGGGRPSHTAFVNPYSGQVIELYTYRETFFYKMFALHRWLLGSQDGIGKLIVGVSTFIFLFIILTGIVLWWPKTKNVLIQRLKVKLDGGWKRLNHDFHIVLGFYSAIFLFVFAFTGLAWSFKWFNDGIYTVTNSEQKPPADPPTSNYQDGKAPINFEAAFTNASTKLKEVEFYNISAPKDSAGTYAVNVLPAGLHEAATDSYYIDQYSGQIIGSSTFSDKSLGQRVRSTFKPVHTGSIFGLPSKIIAFISCVLGVTFPITGTILWLNRLAKKKKKQKKMAVQRA